MDRLIVNNKDVFVIYTNELPANVNGMVKEKSGIYYILIKDTLSSGKKLRTLLHEIDHVQKNDLDSNEKVNLIERRNNG